jgi:dihydrofolate reductase
MIISSIAAIAENNAIGKNNQLLWRLPADLKHFKEITTGHTVIMGRKTFESVGKPLPNRRNIVITRSNTLNIENVEVVNSIEQAIALCNQDEEVFIVGGAEIYQAAMDITNQIYLTVVHANFEADTYFPEIDPMIWEQTAVEKHEANEKNPFAYTFSTLIRK